MFARIFALGMVENGKTVEVPARYTFLYEKKDDRPAIVEHHSSIRPEIFVLKKIKFV